MPFACPPCAALFCLFTCERAPHASASDPFEETKKLLAEAMETGSAASDEDFSDDEVDEVDEVDEGDSDGSNGISDYDTSEEDHLLVDDVHLSLMKTRSATKRAKRVPRCENKNYPASNVVSFCARSSHCAGYARSVRRARSIRCAELCSKARKCGAQLIKQEC